MKTFLHIALGALQVLLAAPVVIQVVAQLYTGHWLFEPTETWVSTVFIAFAVAALGSILHLMIEE